MTIAGGRMPQNWNIRSIAALALAATAARFLLYAIFAMHHGAVDTSLCHWDCHWYLDIVDNGYSADPTDHPPKTDLPPRYDEANWAFFPLYPLAVRALTWGRFLTSLDAAILLSLLATAGFLVASSLYLQRTRPKASVPLWMAFVLAYPHSIYLSFPYTESLYLLLATLTLLYLTGEQLYPASFLAALASATRPVGLIFLPPIALKSFRALKSRFSQDAAAPRKRIVDAVLPLLIAPLGIFLYAAFLYGRTGDALAFSHVQIAWGRHLRFFPLELFYGYWHWDLDGFPGQSDTLNAIFATLMIVVGIFLARRKRALESYLCLASVIVPLSTSTDSIARFAAGTAVFLFGLYDLLCAGRSRATTALVLAIFCLFQFLFLQYWFMNAGFLT